MEIGISSTNRLTIQIRLRTFAALLIPGLMGGFFSFIFSPANMQLVFTVMAVVVAGVLGLRIYRRIRPGKPGDGNSITSLFRDPNKS